MKQRAKTKAGSPGQHGHANKAADSYGDQSRARDAHEAAPRVVSRRGAAHGVAVVDSEEAERLARAARAGATAPVPAPSTRSRRRGQPHQ